MKSLIVFAYVCAILPSTAYSQAVPMNSFGISIPVCEEAAHLVAHCVTTRLRSCRFADGAQRCKSATLSHQARAMLHRSNAEGAIMEEVCRFAPRAWAARSQAKLQVVSPSTVCYRTLIACRDPRAQAAERRFCAPTSLRGVRRP